MYGAIPSTTAFVERTFSVLTNIKSDKRSRLGIEVTEAELIVKQFIGTSEKRYQEIVSKYDRNERIQFQKNMGQDLLL